MTRCQSVRGGKKAGDAPQCILPAGHAGKHYNGSGFWNADKQFVRGNAVGPDPRALEW